MKVHPLEQANKFINAISQKIKEITPISFDDFALFQSYFEKEPHTYGNSWTYITQGMYGLGPNNLGYKYFDGSNLSAISIHPKIESPEIHMMYWVRPMGKSVTEKIAEVSSKVRKTYGIGTYAKKLFRNQYDDLISKGFVDIINYPWHSTSPAEDDSFPEQILDVKKTLSYAKNLDKDTRLNRAFRYYKSYSTKTDLVVRKLYDFMQDGISVTYDFFKEQELTKKNNVSSPYDYLNLIKFSCPKSKLHSEIFYINDVAQCFYVVEQLNTRYAGLYASISSNKTVRHLSDYMIFRILYILQKQEVNYLNLGGSENERLNRFKNKYMPSSENEMHWVTNFQT